MIFDTPISWFLNEIIASILFIICIVHISKGKNAIHRMLELFCYVLTAGIFENIGVWAGIYDYSVNRIMMFGKVPFAILFIEGAIVYFVMLLMERINVPYWALPFGAGVLASIQDMTLDPSSVFDIHNFSGSLEGQWNWVKYYEGGFVDIPFFNFSGWLTMVLFFMMCVQIGRYLYHKYQKEWIGYVYPFVSILITVILLASPINHFLLYMVPFFKMNTKSAELFMLCFNYIVCFFIMFKFAKYFFTVFLITAILPLVLMFLWNNSQVQKMHALMSKNGLSNGTAKLEENLKNNLSIQEGEILKNLYYITSNPVGLREIKNSLKDYSIKVVPKPVAMPVSFYEDKNNTLISCTLLPFAHKNCLLYKYASNSW